MPQPFAAELNPPYSNENREAVVGSRSFDASGRIGRDGCAVAVVTTAGRGYWIQLYTGGDGPFPSNVYDQAWFEEVLATMQLHPEDAGD